MQHDPGGRLYDPNPSGVAGLGEIIEVGIRMFRLGLGGLLCLTGFFLALQVFFAGFTFVTEPAELQEVLAVWDTPGGSSAAESPAADPVPAASQELVVEAPIGASEAPAPALPADSSDEVAGVLPTINAILDDLQAGRLARPMGGFVLFMMMTILVQISLGMIKVGAAILQGARARPDAAA